MRVVFLWWTFEGYFASCWRALAARPGVEVHVLARRPDAGSIAPHEARLLDGLDHQLFAEDELKDADRMARVVAELRPDALAVPGWFLPSHRRVACDPRLGDLRVVMACDTPWMGSARQMLRLWGARLAMRDYLRRVDAAVVATSRARELCVRLGLPAEQVRIGMYATDCAWWGEARVMRARSGAWPRRFVVVGRYVPEKGVETLAQAWEKYRAASREPWEIIVCGRGPMRDRLVSLGAIDRGFLGPEALRAELANAGALLLPSLHEPYGMALTEGCAAGLPIVCTSACGAAEFIARPGQNGWIVHPGHVGELAESLLAVGRAGADRLAAMGEASARLAATQDVARWAETWAAALFERSGARTTPGATP